MKYDITNINLAGDGRKKIEWAARQMGVLSAIEARFRRQHPLKGLRIGACLHVTSETARLAQVLKAGGASVALCASNPLSTQDQVAASLVKHDKIAVFARYGENRQAYYSHLSAVLKTKPAITMDDGADLLTLLHKSFSGQTGQMLGSTEETTTGVVRLRALQKSGGLRLPVIAVNDGQTKHMFDNFYGTGQSALDGVIRATNILIAGKTIVVAGYGWCGKGVAKKAAGLGGRVIIAEVDAIKALQAAMDGFAVMPLKKAARQADILITVTGNSGVVGKEIFRDLKDGAVLANAGHFDVEIDVAALRRLAKASTTRPNVEEFKIGKKRIYLLASGRLVNLAAAEGHPASVMDMSFAGQALACEFLAKRGRELAKKVYPLPASLDEQIAALKLQSLGIRIDKLTGSQKKYLEAWEEGT